MSVLLTPRLSMEPITLEIVEAVMLGRREDLERLAGAELPPAWPNHGLIERAFRADLDAIRANPARRLWGDRVMILRASTRRVVGSVVFHGAPDDDGVVEVGYGVEQELQRQGYATEATGAAVDWALDQPGVRAVRAVTPSWHVASRRVLEKLGFSAIGAREHDMLDLVEYERRGAESVGVMRAAV